MVVEGKEGALAVAVGRAAWRGDDCKQDFTLW